MVRHTAIYVRVSSNSQKHASQLPDLEAYAAAAGMPVQWYTDTYTGKTMDRPAWKQLEANLRAGKVATVVCWKIDRLGRKVAGLAALFEELQLRKVNLVSVRDGVDLSSPAGRLLANVLASMAQYEKEVNEERQAEGIRVAKANGKRWGGSKAGVPKKVTPEKERAIKTLYDAGTPISRIAKAVALSRPTVYEVLGVTARGTVIA